MRRHGQPSRELDLFDLPLVVDPEIADEADRSVKRSAAREEREPASSGGEQIELPKPEARALADATGRAHRLAAALIRRRFQAGLIDTAVCGAGLAAAIAGTVLLGVPLRAADWPAYLLTALLFSFFYTVFALAFWGHTPGMIRAHLTVAGRDGGALATGQAMLRWLGGVATVALLGLPTFLALRDRRSLADLLSGTRLSG